MYFDSMFENEPCVKFKHVKNIYDTLTRTDLMQTLQEVDALLCEDTMVLRKKC